MSQGSQKIMKIRRPPFIHPIKGVKVPSPLVREGLDEWYFRTNTIVNGKTKLIWHFMRYLFHPAVFLVQRTK